MRAVFGGAGITATQVPPTRPPGPHSRAGTLQRPSWGPQQGFAMPRVEARVRVDEAPGAAAAVATRGPAGIPVPTAACEAGPVLPTVVSSLDATVGLEGPRLTAAELRSAPGLGRAPPALCRAEGRCTCCSWRPVQLCTLLPSCGQPGWTGARSGFYLCCIRSVASEHPSRVELHHSCPGPTAWQGHLPTQRP